MAENELKNMNNKKDRLREITKTLRGDDSEDDEDYYEYDEEGEEDGSDSSEEEQLGFKKAIGIDPEEVKHFGYHTNPENGSQYLLNAMLERKNVPKIAVADPNVLQAKISKKKKLADVKQQITTDKESSSNEFNGSMDHENDEVINQYLDLRPFKV